MARLTTVGDSAASLSRELSDFLIELSIGLHKNAIYPPGHPLLDSATAGIVRRVDALLKDLASLSLGVARQQLVIEGVATDENNPVLRDLAQRLHRHHLGAVKFTQGVSAGGKHRAPPPGAGGGGGGAPTTPPAGGAAVFPPADLATVAEDAGRRSKPLGLEGPEV